MGSSSSTEAPEIPTKMKRIVLVQSSEDFDKVKFEVQECDVPVPKSGEVLVKVCGAAVNPSDYGTFRNVEVNPDEPLYFGKEGSGVVVASGGGMQANGLVGKNVGMVFSSNKNGGTYQEYVVAPAMQSCFALPDNVPVEDAASFFVNPYTAVGIIATARDLKSPGFVHTAAASQLGQMLVKLCQKENMTLINVVRRDEQAEMLKALGAEHIVVSSKDGWKDELAKLVEKTGITCAFDAISGESPGDMVDVMPKGGTTFVYGGLSDKPISGVKTMDLIYRQKKIQGWLLTDYLKGAAGGQVGMLMRINAASKVVLPALAGGWSASQFVDVKPEDMWTKFLEMKKGGGFTNQKLRIRWYEAQAATS